MPRRVLRALSAKWTGWLTRDPNPIITILAFALVIALGFAVAGWNAARNAEHRVTRVELGRAADQAVAEEGRKIGQVATCFSAARSRPPLTEVLRFIGALASNDPVARESVETLVKVFEQQATSGIRGEPTKAKCLQLAERLGVDPRPYNLEEEEQ